MEQDIKTQLHLVEVTQVSANTFALTVNEKLYYIGATLYKIIHYAKAGSTAAEIQALLAAEFNVAVTPQKITQILQDAVGKILATAGNAPAHKQLPIYGKVKLIGERTLSQLTRRLELFFHKAVGVPLLVLALAATGLFLFRLHEAHILHSSMTARRSIGLVLSGYLFFMVVGLFHELGHATAAARYKSSPKEVGFGFYLVLPVLYTDVSKIWLLNKSRRILVNLAGIYFQLLANIVLYAAYELCRYNNLGIKYIIISFFLTNALLALYALNPFFRNDGYWIFSDLFSIPNLSAATQGYPLKCWRYLRSQGRTAFRGAGLSTKTEWALLLYTLGRLGMISWLAHLGYTNSRDNVHELLLRIEHRGQLSNEDPLESIFHLVKMVLFCVLFLVLVYRTLRPLGHWLLGRLRLAWPVARPEPLATPS